VSASSGSKYRHETGSTQPANRDYLLPLNGGNLYDMGVVLLTENRPSPLQDSFRWASVFDGYRQECTSRLVCGVWKKDVQLWVEMQYRGVRGTRLTT
jgi:hypothetical protein